MALEYHRDRASGAGERETEQELALEYEYGVTADWTVKAEIPLVDKNSNGDGSTGIGDMVLGTKYRFLRVDSPGTQYSTTLLFQAKLPTGDDDRSPRLGSGSTDFVGGLLHGLESRRWYYNTAARYRLNTEGGGDLEKGDKVFLDIVGGVRPVLTKYKEPDTVFFLELNFENAERDTPSEERRRRHGRVGIVSCHRAFSGPIGPMRSRQGCSFRLLKISTAPRQRPTTVSR